MYPFSGTIPARRMHRTPQANPRPTYNLNRLVAAACQVNDVGIDIVQAQGRKRILPVARVVEQVSFLATQHSQRQIARVLHRDRSAISAAKVRAKWNVSKDDDYRGMVDKIREVAL